METQVHRMPLTAAKKKAVVALEPDGVLWHRTEGSILVPAERAVVITIGVRLRSQGQWSKNWRASYGRSHQLRKLVMHRLNCVWTEHVTRHLQGAPTKVRFVRLAPRMLDSDNLASVFKPVRDQVCCWLAGDNTPSARANDGMRSGYEFSYHQQQQKLYGVRIELSR